ncbi:MAG: hypothetical protein Q4G05_01315 [Clostridia bacterium]|nr:hypothetical protein [Clostridia bacterium]
MGCFVGVSKLVNDHLESNINNHDYAFLIPGTRFVLDECGFEKHGFKLFSQQMIKKVKKETNY